MRLPWGAGGDIPSEVIQTADGNYVVAGYVGSHNTGDVTGHDELALFDYWIVKLSSGEALLWQKAVGGTQQDWARAIVEVPGGGIVVAGGTSSSDGDVQNNNGGGEFWVVKFSKDGDLIWQQTYGGTKNDFCFDITKSADNGFALAGYTWSNDGDVLGSINRGQNDFWVLKLSPEPSTLTNTPLTAQITLYPNPAHNTITLQAPSAGTTLNVTIYDLLGRTLLREEIPNGGQLNIAALQKGVYFVSAEDGDGAVFRGKLEKE